MFIRNAWYVGAWADELLERPVGRRICGEPLVLFRDREGAVAALEDRCCHRGLPLQLGKIVERGLQCGYHGLTFDRRGRCVHIPAQERIPDSAKVRSYPVREKDGLIWVWIGDPARAAEARLLDYPYHAGWPHKHDMLHVEANYLLLADNLMDASHIGYVHTRTIGGDPLGYMQTKDRLTRGPEHVKLTSWMLDVDPPPGYVRSVGFNGRIDRWLEREFVAPSSVLLWTGGVEAGLGAYETDRREGGFSLRMFNGLTPETETSTFYFWSTANGHRQNEPVATEEVFAQAKATFAEDKAVVEEQQRRLAELGEAGLIDVATDRARVQMRRIVERILAEQGGDP